MFRSCAGLVALSSLLLSGAALAQEKIKVGVTATLEGTYTVLGEDGIRGHQTALNTLGKKVGEGFKKAGQVGNRNANVVLVRREGGDSGADVQPDVPEVIWVSQVRAVDCGGEAILKAGVGPFGGA